MKSLNCIIETPKGYGVKYDYDPKLGNVELTKVLPAGMVFPFDFGFITGTIGEDGDPLDVIVISEVKSIPGCAMKCRIIGSVVAEQQERDGEEVRNDRYLGIPEVSVLYRDVNEIDELPEDVLKQIELFFVGYNEQAGKTFTPKKRITSTDAIKLIEKSQNDPEPNRMIQLLLPLYDARQRPFPKKHFDAVEQKLLKEFGGVTAYTQSPAAGLWMTEGDELMKDSVVIYEVMTSKVDRSFWEKYRTKLEKKFGQKALIVRQSEIGLL